MGSHVFREVTIPVLWGTRAILQDSQGRISVIDLAPTKAKLEILGDRPAKGVRYSPRVDGYTVLARNRRELYTYSPDDKRLTGLSIRLPDIQIARDQIRVGTNSFSATSVSGLGVGIAVTETGIALGAPLPSDLAPLVIPGA